MRAFARILIVLVVFLGLSQMSAQQVGPTTLTAESANNTSASSSFAGLTDFRTADSNTVPSLGSPIVTNPFEVTPKNVSKLDPGAPRGSVGDVHNLVYNGFNGKVFVETQTWSCTSAHGHMSQITRNYSSSNSHVFATCNQHQLSGYDSVTASQDSAAIDDMFSRGFDGFMADSSGDPNGCVFPNFNTSCQILQGTGISIVDTAIGAMRSRINTAYSSSMQYAIIEDQSAFQSDCAGSQPNQNSKNQPQCVEGKLLHDINYYNVTKGYFADGTYLKVNGSVPVLLFFIDELDAPFSFSQCTSSSPCSLLNSATCTGGTDCWNKIWDAVATQGVALKLVFQNRGGFSHRDASGGYAWVHPDPTSSNSQITTTTQDNWDDDFSGAAHAINVSPTNSNYLGDFYRGAECIYSGGCSGFTAIGIVYKGFDREDAGFVAAASQGKVTAEQCGQTWLETFQKISGPDDQNGNSPYFSSAHQLPFLQVATWDDYDEGSEIETGIDNCVNESSISVTQPDHTTAIGWQFQFTDVTNGSLSTIDRYRLFFTQNTDGTNLFGIDVFPACALNSGLVTCSGIDLNALRTWPSGNYQVYIKALGKPSIVNHMFSSSFLQYTPSVVSTTPANSLTFTVPPDTSKPVQISNTGAFDVTIKSLSITQSGTPFQITSQNCIGAVLPAQTGSCTATITYTPTPGQTGDSGTLVIGHNGANGNTSLPLIGNTPPPPPNQVTIVGIDDMSGWSQTEGAAAGAVHLNQASPSLDGNSLQLSLVSGPSYSYAKFEVDLGPPSINSSEYVLDFQVQIDNPGNPEMLEFGVSQVLSGSDYAFHVACDFKNQKVWKVWNASGNSWSNTSVACTPFPASTWMHISFDVQRTTVGQLLYKSLTVNGTNYPINQTFNPASESPNNVEISVVLYGDKNTDPYSIWIDSMQLTEIQM
jgi:hypothetical protein